jgi:FkbM family methyltransferase
LRQNLLQLTTLRPIGAPLALAAKAFGQESVSRKISTMCRFAPDWVPVYPPGEEGSPFHMSGEGGRESVARALWFGGWRGFEFPMPDMFAALARQVPTMLDIGSFSGFYSLVTARMNPQATIFAFEPFPPAQALIKRNIEKNGFQERITVVEAALSDAPGFATLNVPTTKTGLIETASSIEETYKRDTLEAIDVEKTTLDIVCARYGIRDIALIKLDVEKHEEAVLRGGRRTFEENRPILFMEILRDMDTKFFADFFPALDYDNFVLHKDHVTYERDIRNDPTYFNHILCPREKRSDIKAAAKESGLVFRDD